MFFYFYLINSELTLVNKNPISGITSIKGAFSLLYFRGQLFYVISLNPDDISHYFNSEN